MGGRGAYWSGRSSHYETREYDTIDYIDKMKVVRKRDGVKSQDTFPLYSNTPNTAYYVANSTGEIKTITVYRNHKLVSSVDITSQGVHYHRWVDGEVSRHGKTTPTRRKIKRELSISGTRFKRLYEKAMAYNRW